MKAECKVCGGPAPSHKTIQGVCPQCRKELYEMETSQDVLKTRKLDTRQARDWFIIAGLVVAGLVVYGFFSGQIGI